MTHHSSPQERGSALPALYTPDTLAERWGCSGRQVRLLILSGKLRAFRVGERLFRITAAAVEDYECQTIDLPATMEDNFDPAKVQRTVQTLREMSSWTDRNWVAVDVEDLRLILRALDEGREASAPFAVVVADYKKQTQVESDPDYPMLGRIGWEEDPRPPQVRWRELDRLAAWSEAVSDPKGKNT